MIIGLIDIISIVDLVVIEKGDECLGHLSWYGVMVSLERYFGGKYDENAYKFISNNIEYFEKYGLRKYNDFVVLDEKL